MVFEVCAVLLTIGILVFLIYAIIALKKSTELLNKIGPDVQEVLHDTHFIAEDLKTKLDNLGPAFRLVNGVSSTAEEGIAALKRRSFINMTGSFINLNADKTEKANELAENVLNILDLATMVVGLWRKKK